MHRMSPTTVATLTVLELLIVLTYLPGVLAEHAWTYEAARERCGLNASSLASPTLLRRAAQAGVLSQDVYWLPIQRTRLDQWQWLDGSTYGESLSAGGDIDVSGKRCGVIRTEQQVMAANNCYRPLTGFLCKARANTTCSHDCQPLVDLNVMVFQRHVTWYQARDACVETGSDLAVFETSKKETILQLLHQILNKQGHFWIGLRREKWTLNGASVGRHHWSPGQPPESGDCAAISVATRNWTTLPCSQQHASVCTNQLNELGVTEEDTGMDEHSSWRLNVPLLIGALVALLFLLIFLIVGLFYIKRKCLTPAKPTHPEGIEDTDGVELMEMK